MEKQDLCVVCVCVCGEEGEREWPCGEGRRKVFGRRLLF